MFDAPEHVFGAVAADAEVERVVFGVVLRPHRLSPAPAPPVGDGVSDEDQLDRPLLQKCGLVLQKLLVAFRVLLSRSARFGFVLSAGF